MDALTHVFLPLTVACVVVATRFPTPRYLALGAFGLAPDLDKLLGVPGLLHSALTIVPLCVALIALDRWRADVFPYGTIAAALVLSHLLLDFVDGSGAYLLYPLVETGVGLGYPATVTFGEGLLGVTFDGWPVVLETRSAPVGFRESPFVASNTFGFVGPTGVASVLAFGAVWVGRGRYAATGTRGADT